MLTRIREFGRIIVVFSGGDALKRPDIVDLVRHGAALGLRMAITPATTPLCDRDMMARLKDAGLARLAVSLDGSTPQIHDTFRRVEGSFDHRLRILREAREVGLTTQVNTVVRRNNIDDMAAMCVLMGTLGIVFWEVFFLVPMGRAKPEDVASGAEFEAVFNQLYDLSQDAAFDLKATADPQFSRVVLFVSHIGDIYPSGFLPITAGNVRTDDIVEVYRNAPLFTQLRDRNNLTGKCGVCNYRSFCGGCRARAYAVTGDPFAEEPFCDYTPPRALAVR